MANVRITQLPEDANPSGANDYVAIDNGTGTRRTSLTSVANSGRPFATQAQAEAGVDTTTAMNPLTTKQAIEAIGGAQFATAAQGDLADTALQPTDIGSTVQAHDALLDSVSSLALQAGDIIVATAPDTVTRLPKGGEGQVLAVSGGNVAWESTVQDAQTVNGVVPGTTGLALLADETPADVRNDIDAPVYVADYPALKAIDTSKDKSIILTDSLRGGSFSVVLSDLSGLLARFTATTTAVDPGTDTCTRNLHGLWTGAAFLVTAPVDGLSVETVYYSIRIDDSNFKVATSFENAHDGIAVDLTGSTNFTYKRLLDPLQGVYVIPNGFALDGSQGAIVRKRSGFDVSAHWFNYEGRNNPATNDSPSLQAAINFAAEAFYGAAGNVVHVGTGIGFLAQKIYLPNRAGVYGSGGRGTVFKPHSSFTANEMFHNINTGLIGEPSTSSTFFSRMVDCYIDARGYNMTQVIVADAWQETCGLERVLIQFNGTTRFGLQLQNGYGGASYLRLRDVEIFTDSTHAQRAGIRVSQISSVGGFILSVDSCSIVGSTTNPLVNGIQIDNDSAIITSYHVEYCINAINMAGVGSLSVDTLTGSANAVTNLIAFASNFTGRWNLRNLIPNGATGNTIQNNGTGEHIPASEGILDEYVGPKSGFLARMATDKTNLTGNGAIAVVPFDTEVFDRRGEYNPATGFFTAVRTGKYNFSAYVNLGPMPIGTTNCVVSLVTSTRTYELFRGDAEAIRDSSSNVTLGGSITSVDLNSGGLARVAVTITGLAGNTVGVLADASYFSGSWIER